MTHSTSTPAGADSPDTPLRMFASHHACLHGINPHSVQLRRTETHGTLDGGVMRSLTITFTGTGIDIRIDLDSDEATLRRDQLGLARLAEVAAEAAIAVNDRLTAVTA